MTNDLTNRRKEPHYWIYMLQCHRDKIYTGITPEILRRYREHLTGKQGARFTRSFPPEQVLQCWRLFADRSLAQRIEFFLKNNTRSKKLNFIQRPQSLKPLLEKNWKVLVSLYCFSPAVINQMIETESNLDNMLVLLPAEDYPAITEFNK